MPKFRLMLSAAPVLAAALLATPGYAQQTAAPQAAQEPGAQEDDIVVVAQGRSQLLSTVPVAVSAVTAESLQNSGANDIRQLNQVAPSLLVSSTGNEANGSARIRGIGTVGDNPGLESSVAVFIDGVYRSRSGIGLNELGEIERVEVLRGPQGTLGGRNSSAGLITIVSKKPEFQFGANAEATYGNYNYYRLAAGITGPLTETLAARIDGVYVKRDGFYRDTTNNTDVNNRDRFFVRGQLLFNPTSDLSLRLIGDYTQRTEACCAATYVDSSINPYIGDLNNLAVPLTTGSLPPANGNNIINVLRDLGQPIAAFNAGYTRNISVSPGRTFGGRTTDGGVSLEANWDFGGAKLTSITAYREYKNSQASDTDYSSVDILYRADNRENDYRRFRTFTQEVRLQGNAFGDRLDWLVGGFYANESLQVTDNLRFGNQYGRFATCRLVSGGALAALYSPTSPGCLAARPAAFGAASPIIYGAIDALDSINDKGSIRDVYNQTSDNWALFTHNIVHITSKLDLTLGLRYTQDIKNFNATFTNDNTACVANQAALSAFFTNASLAAVSQGIVGLSCQGNSTSELNNVSIVSRRSEGEFTGTAILSYRPTSNLMTYASYSRGYKAGGFNLDRSALKSPLVSFASLGGAQALVGNLQFDPEKVNAYEIGAKYSTGPLSISVAAFRQEFSNFQLNTFNGSVFIVQTINGCKTDLGTGPTDLSATTGACAVSDVTYGVVSQGVELEAALRPTRNVRVALGMTYTDAKYERNLIGNQSGTPLDPALRVLPGNTMSNAPQVVTTGSFTWTPDIGTSGLSGLLYIDGRMTGDYNTGSDLFPQKAQDGYLVVNARAGIRGADDRWSIEVWAQNLLNKDYAQVAFNSPFQAGATAAPFVDPQYPGGRQIFSQFLAEPRTFGVTVRGKF